MAGDFLSTFEQFVLMALVRLRDDAYGRRIHEDVESRTETAIALGQVYVTLERLETKGMVRSSMGEATAVRGGRAKRYFEITAAGHSALDATQRALSAMKGRLSFAGGRA